MAMTGPDRREARPLGTAATILLTLALLAFLAWLVVGLVRDFWVILIALMQP
jgi:hypothetical protein